jgi:hypothetical protein
LTPTGLLMEGRYTQNPSPRPATILLFAKLPIAACPFARAVRAGQLKKPGPGAGDRGWGVA